MRATASDGRVVREVIECGGQARVRLLVAAEELLERRTLDGELQPEAPARRRWQGRGCRGLPHGCSRSGQLPPPSRRSPSGGRFGPLAAQPRGAGRAQARTNGPHWRVLAERRPPQLRAGRRRRSDRRAGRRAGRGGRAWPPVRPAPRARWRSARGRQASSRARRTRTPRDGPADAESGTGAAPPPIAPDPGRRAHRSRPGRPAPLGPRQPGRGRARRGLLPRPRPRRGAVPAPKARRVRERWLRPPRWARHPRPRRSASRVSCHPPASQLEHVERISSAPAIDAFGLRLIREAHEHLRVGGYQRAKRYRVDGFGSAQGGVHHRFGRVVGLSRGEAPRPARHGRGEDA